MTTFLIHHFEEMWSEGLEKFGTNIEAEFSKILNFLENKKSEINEVIMTNFELGEDEPHQLAIKAFCEAENISFKTYEYGYGWSKDQYEYDPELVSEANRGVTWCDATREYYDEDDGYILLINEWQRDLKGQKVLLAGAFAGECLDDMHTVLKTVGANVSYVEALCVGMNEEYEFTFSGQTREEMSSKLNQLISDLEAQINDNNAGALFDDLTNFLSGNKNYAEWFFSEDWEGDNDRLFDDLLYYIHDDFDESHLNNVEEYSNSSLTY